MLLWKSGYPYEYINDWQKLNIETSLPEKDDFYSQLNIENISDADYKHAKRVCKDFKIRDYMINIVIVNIIIFMFKVMHFYLLIHLIFFEIFILN